MKKRPDKNHITFFSKQRWNKILLFFAGSIKYSNVGGRKQRDARTGANYKKRATKEM